MTRRRSDALRTVSCGVKFDVELIGLRSAVSMRWPTVVMVVMVSVMLVVVVVIVTVVMVYLGHATDFYAGLATYSPFLSAKSETKCRRNRIENFFRNPAYIRQRTPSVRRTALTCSIGTWRFPQLPLGEEDVGTRPNLPVPIHPYLPDILISDKKQTFTWCRWFTPILPLLDARELLPLSEGRPSF